MGKQILWFILGLFVGALVVFATNTFIEGKKAPAQDQEEVQSEQVEQYLIGEFTDANQFINYVADLREEAIIDSILIHAPSEQVQQITNVCINKYRKVDRHIFFTEYTESYNKVYKYLDPDQQQNMNNTIPDPAQSNSAATTEPNKGGNQAQNGDTIASVSLVKESTTKVTN